MPVLDRELVLSAIGSEASGKEPVLASSRYFLASQAAYLARGIIWSDKGSSSNWS